MKKNNKTQEKEALSEKMRDQLIALGQTVLELNLLQKGVDISKKEKKQIILDLVDDYNVGKAVVAMMQATLDIIYQYEYTDEDEDEEDEDEEDEEEDDE